MRPKGVAMYLAHAAAAAADGRFAPESTIGRVQRALSLAQGAHASFGSAAFEEEVGADKYAAFVSDFNAARAAALVIDPDAVVPAAL